MRYILLFALIVASSTPSRAGYLVVFEDALNDSFSPIGGAVGTDDGPVDIAQVAFEVDDTQVEVQIFFSQDTLVRPQSQNGMGTPFEGLFEIDADRSATTGFNPGPGDAFRTINSVPASGLGVELVIDFGQESQTPGSFTIVIPGVIEELTPATFGERTVSFSISRELLHQAGVESSFDFALLVGNGERFTDAGPNTFGTVSIVAEPRSEFLALSILLTAVLFGFVLRSLKDRTHTHTGD